MYLNSTKEDLLNFDFVIPEFFNREKFKINKELISNKLTKQYIEEDSKLEYIYKCILSSFNRKKKKPIGVFTDGTVTLFNDFVQKIQNAIDFYFNKKSETDLTKSGLIDFGKFFEIEISKDGDGEVYPDVYAELERGRDEKKKKGKGESWSGKTKK